ncbi:MAG TPA: HD domain-containing phosphohydrolase, partial [Desulfitobacteriaceae bacterium]|nr:HD domain-containing phosphohydrolase [Desulfitobacteriaceae bacterium]
AVYYSSVIEPGMVLSGLCYGLIWDVKDVTPMSDLFYKLVIEQLPIGYVNFKIINNEIGETSDFELLEVNAAFEQIIDTTREKIIGKRLKQHGYLVELIQPELFDTLIRVASTGGTEVVTYYLKDVDAWFKVSVFLSEKDSIIVLFSDISASVRPFSEIDVFFNISSDLLCIAQSDGCHLKVNQAWENVLGYTREEIEGQYYWQFLHPDDLTNTEMVIKQLESPNQIMSFVNRYRHKDGSYRDLEWTSQSDGKKIYSIARDVTERKKWEKQIEYLSYHDILTGLYNRRFLEKEIKGLDIAENLPISIILGDINRLKLVNDAFGHDKGDELIVKAAETIKTSCRPEDLIVRWGGDEFMVFLPKTSRPDTVKIVNRIQANCADKHVYSIALSLSFGIGTKISADEAMFDIVREAEESMYKTKFLESERNRKDIINAIVNTFYNKYPFEEKHAKRVSALCQKTALALEFDQNEVEKIALAGLMHDIGKVAVSIQILEKPGSLTETEWNEIRNHAEIGYKVVGSTPEMADVGYAILAHHERLDGKGYPKGLKEEEIPIAARIISIADSFDTMTSQSLYRDKMTIEEAISEIRTNKGTQFDPAIAEVFIQKVLQGGKILKSD